MLLFCLLSTSSDFSDISFWTYLICISIAHRAGTVYHLALCITLGSTLLMCLFVYVICPVSLSLHV